MVCIDQPCPFQAIEQASPFPSQNLEPSLLERLDLCNLDTLCETTPRYNVAPTQPVLAIRQSDERRRALVRLRWGLVPAWSKGPDSRYSMINARAETVKSKPAYRNGFKHRRCLIPAEGFYEWKAGGAASKAENLAGCKSLRRQLPDFGRLAYPLLGEVTNRDMRGSKSHGCPDRRDLDAVGATWVASKSGGLNISE